MVTGEVNPRGGAEAKASLNRAARVPIKCLHFMGARSQ